MKLMPGVLLTVALAYCALYVSHSGWVQPWGISASLLAIVGGMLIGNTIYHRMAPVCHAGVDFSKQKILRLAIILFGLRLTLQDVASVGVTAVLIDATVICTTFGLTIWLGRKWFGLDRHSIILIGSGCSICGAAAVMATESLIKARTEKVTMAVATVVVFGTLAMLIYPLLYPLILKYWGVSEFSFGIFTGSTIHEVAQVVAAGNAIGEHAADTAVISKMIRVLMLAPFLLALSTWQLREQNGSQNENDLPRNAQITIPWFAVGFMFMAVINSLHILPDPLVQSVIYADDVMMTTAMAALGLTSHVSAFRKAGIKPLLLAALMFGWLVIGGGMINVGFNLLLR